MFEFLEIPNKMEQGDTVIAQNKEEGYEIEFRNVSFKYPGQENYTLRNVSMRFCAGQRLAIVGMNGNGKTTFIKLLCRLYDPTEGEILLNGIDIRKYNYQEYMQLFSIVFQDFKLLSFELGQNVAGSLNVDPGKAENYVDGIVRVYNNDICEVIDNYNGSAFYEPSYVIARAYQNGGF